MDSFCWISYHTREEIYELNRCAILESGALNTEQALRWLEENPDIELYWYGVNDLYKRLGMRPSFKEIYDGWLVKVGEEPEIIIGGVPLEEFIKKQDLSLKGIAVENYWR